jgi:PleD family two-component response regulator
LSGVALFAQRAIACLCRQVAEEVKRRQDTYRHTLQRWKGDQQALSLWQTKMETMLAAIEAVQAKA